MNLKTVSKNRYNGGVKAKRLYGSSTITTFYVMRVEDEKNPQFWVTVEVGGKTPGERATAAKAKAEPIIRELLSKAGI
jgi:hypothetical protein